MTTVAHGLRTLRECGWSVTGVLDVGAYTGEWALMAADTFPEAHILMVEAQPELEVTLKYAASVHPGKIDYVLTLLGSERREGVDFFRTSPVSTGSSIYAEQTSFPRTVLRLPMRRLDDVVKDCGKAVYNLLKLDVQGAELEVLNGAQQSLPGVEAVVMEVSLLEYNKGAPLFADVTAAMSAYGFSIYDVFPLTRTNAGALIQVDAIFVRTNSHLRPAPPFF